MVQSFLSKYLNQGDVRRPLLLADVVRQADFRLQRKAFTFIGMGNLLFCPGNDALTCEVGDTGHSGSGSRIRPALAIVTVHATVVGPLSSWIRRAANLNLQSFPTDSSIHLKLI